MFDEKEIKQLQGMFALSETYIVENIRLYVDERISQAEQRTEQRIVQAEQRIISGVADIIGSSIVPQLDDHHCRLNRLERRVLTA